jgi:hypothetical protein
VYAVIGRVKIKPGHEDETLSMIRERGVGMLQGMPDCGTVEPGRETGTWQPPRVAPFSVRTSSFKLDSAPREREEELL